VQLTLRTASARQNKCHKISHSHMSLWLKAHSHRARLSFAPSTSVVRRTRRHRPTDFDPRRRSTSTSVNKHKRAQNRARFDLNAYRRTWCEHAVLLACVPYRRRRASIRATTRVDGHRHT